MQMSQLHELFVMKLQDLYSAEQQILEALPKMIKKARSSDLQAGFEEHLEQTQGHVERLEQIASELDFSLEGKTCKGMEGLLKEGEEVMKELEQSSILDLAMIGAAQSVEHYEMAGYGTARALAEAMEHDEAAEILQETLDEEGETDEKLTEVAETILSEMESAEE